MTRWMVPLAAAVAVSMWAPLLRPVRAQSFGGPPLLSATRAQAFAYAATHKLRYLPGEVLIKFKTGMTVSGAQRALQRLPSRPDVSTLKWTGDVALLHDEAELDSRVLASQLTGQFEVAYAQPNYIRQVDATPNDPDYLARQWNFAAIGLPKAWDLNYGATSATIVALVDTGVTVVPAQNLFLQTYSGASIVTFAIPFGPSPDLDPARFFRPADFTVSLTSPSSFVVDTDGHGTHVASTMAESTNNGVDLAGIAFNARLMPIKVCSSYWDIVFASAASGLPAPPAGSGGCSDDAIAAGIRYAADNGANALNISLGGSDPDSILQDALNYAVSKGTFVAIAMGNAFQSGNATQYPAAYAPGIDGVMSVAAVGQNNLHAYYSSTGNYCEISAPGGDVHNGGTAGEIYQDTVSQSASSPFLVFPRFDVYEETPFQGTSMATPHVAGVAALIKSTYPGLTPAAIEKLIARTALNIGIKSTFGAGLIQPRAALAGSGIVK